MIIRLAFLLLAIVSLASCSFSKKATGTSDLQIFMSGSYNSSNEATLDSSFYDISLEMHPIWTVKYPGRYLYVEQAVTANKSKPYRQRVYELIQDGDQYISRVFELPEPEKAVGAYSPDHSLWSSLTPEDLKIREGCDVVLKQVERNVYQGSTVDKNCKSSLRGASYATSEVKLDKTGINSWDRGYNNADEQVWGAVKAGYVFDRQ